MEKTAALQQFNNNHVEEEDDHDPDRDDVKLYEEDEDYKYMADEALFRRRARAEYEREESPPIPDLFGDSSEIDDDDMEDEIDIKHDDNIKKEGFRECIRNMFGSIFGIFTIFSTIYTLIYRCFITGYTLHCVGITRPSKFKKSEYKLMDNIDTDPTFTTLITKLQPEDKISDLKQVIKKTYGIDDIHDVLILFAHHFLTDNNATLESVGITNNSLLTIAVSKFSKAVIPPPIEPEPVRARTPTPPPVIVYDSDSESDSDYPGKIMTFFSIFCTFLVAFLRICLKIMILHHMQMKSMQCLKCMKIMNLSKNPLLM